MISREERAKQVFEKERAQRFASVDRAMGILMALQWLFGCLLALLTTPASYEGPTRSINQNLVLAIVFGGLITFFPVVLSIKRPGQTLTRHVIASSQMIWSALLIHLTGGRIETHFHVFGSLAFLAMYLDWTVLLNATAVTGAHHIIFGQLVPGAVFGTIEVNSWRWAEHVGWVVFEDVVLFWSCERNVRQMRRVADREAALEIARETTESQVQERTKELREAVEAAYQANEAKDQFLRNMSHELKTPLNAIYGSVHLLQRSSVDLHSEELVKHISAGATKLAALLTNILDFARIEKTGLQINPSPMDFNETISEIAELWEDAVVAKGLEMRVSLSNERLLGTSDARRVRQVLSNLIENAVKFTPKGRVEVRFRWKDEEDGPTHALIEVFDTGIGIAEEQLGRMFASFTQADESTTREYGGAGIGLAVSHALVRAMGGVIAVVSEPGVGSTFTVALPVERCQTLPETWKGKGGERMIVKKLHLRIGLLGGSEFGNRAMSQVLRNWSCVVLQSDLSDVDAIIWDEPSEEELRAFPGTGIPMVVLLPPALDEDLGRLVRSRGRLVVRKPVSPQELHRALQQTAAAAVA